MARIACPVTWCDRLMPASRRVCAACHVSFERDLGDVPSLAHHLQLALARQVRIGDGGGPRGTERPLPFDQRAGEAATLLHTTAAAWVNSLRAGVTVMDGPVCAGGCTHPTCLYITLSTDPGPSTAGQARWLLRHLRVMLGRDSAAQAVEQLTEAIRQARHTIDRPLEQVYAGPCDLCGADMYARPGASRVTCPTCVDGQGQRVGYGVQQRREWMLAEIEEMRLSAPDICRALTTLVRPIQPALLYTWVKRRRLTPVGLDVHGRALFRVGDVTALMEGSTRATSVPV
ncbi:hypothetical protein ACQP2T_28145 [Nonomuraea sp. CA-143628]|uniref:hypothetical protein n=1 Tax=Nonomuraea sp. CA-143628 TaxID=3239997 RepID=UPI003D8F1050